MCVCSQRLFIQDDHMVVAIQDRLAGPCPGQQVSPGIQQDEGKKDKHCHMYVYIVYK